MGLNDQGLGENRKHLSRFLKEVVDFAEMTLSGVEFHISITEI